MGPASLRTVSDEVPADCRRLDGESRHVQGPRGPGLGVLRNRHKSASFL
jgi:hypothetical protein